MSPRALRIVRSPAIIVFALLLLQLATTQALALDWSQPWSLAPNPAAAAAQSDEYAWRLFVALNWPTNQRGEPDSSAPLGANRPVVWQAWLHAGELFLETGADPGPWPTHRPPLPLERRFETVSRKERPNLRHIVGGVMVPLADPVAEARRLTEIRFNRASFEFIRARELYNAEGQLRAYSAGPTVSFPYGARQVKAKWRPITTSERSRYYTMQLTLADGTQRLYGLTALHIASKDLSNWFWATFEQVDNPTLADNEGWELPSKDRFACSSQPGDCNQAPSGIGLETTVWRYYRLRGTLTQYTNAQGQPLRLANSELESGMQGSSSCITCHARSAMVAAGGGIERLPIFDTRDNQVNQPPRRLGYVGSPDPSWFEPSGAGGPHFQQLDFVWSLTQAQQKSVPAATP